VPVEFYGRVGGNVPLAEELLSRLLAPVVSASEWAV